MDGAVLSTLFRKEVREAGRNRWLLLFGAGFTLAALAFSVLGLSGLGTFGIAGFGRTAASLLQLVMLLVPLMGLLVGAMGIASEREHGTLLTLMAQPVTAGEVFAGKFLGHLTALSLALLIGFAASGGVIGASGHSAQMAGFLWLAVLTLLLGAAHLGLGLWISSVTSRVSTAVGFALAAWLVLVFLSDLGVMGTAMILRFSPSQLLWIAMLNPVQAFKLGVVASLHGTLETLGPSGRYAMEALGPAAVPVMASTLIGWIGLALGAAFWGFRRRGAL